MKRRNLLQSALGTGGLLSLGGCALNPLGPEVAQLTRPLNERIEAWMQTEGAVPEFAQNQVEPAALLVNSFNGVPEINPTSFSLTVDGFVQQPQQLSLGALGQLPQQEMVIRHVCVEGLAAIVAWGGVRLGDVLRLAGVSPLAGYLAFESADGYFETWDLRTALHPQTLLATQPHWSPLTCCQWGSSAVGLPPEAGLQTEQVDHRYPRALCPESSAARHVGRSRL